MAEIIAAVDEVGATELLHDAEAALGMPSTSGTEMLGPFRLDWTASAGLSGGSVDLIPPNVVRMQNMRLDFAVTGRLSIDLSDVIGDFCLPQACVDIPCVGEVCTPTICINWPTISTPTIPFSDFVNFDADFTLDIQLVSGQWEVSAVVVGTPFLQLGPASTLFIAALTAALSLALLAVPFIGPFLALVVAVAGAALAIAGATGLLGPLITPFISGLRIPLYSQPQTFPVLPASGPLDPAVFITLDDVKAAVDGSGGEDELVLTVDVSP